MKNLSMLLSLFFWGVVLNCLRLMVGAYPGFTQSLFLWASIVFFCGACGLLVHGIWDGWCHRHDHVEDDEVTHEN